MAQSGYTPIKIYSSSTAAAVPLAANLAAGELAINTNDGKLFYEDSGGVVQVIGWKTTPATAGGTGQTSYAVGDLLYASTTTALSKLADVATGNVLTSGGVNVAPAWGKVALATAVSGSLPAANGGTGQTVYAVGDILYASTTTALSKLADVATGSAIISGGVGVAPAWGKIGLTTHVSGTLPIANGGTNSTATATAGGVGYGTGTAHAYTAAGTAGQVLISAAGAAPTWSSGTGTGSVVFSNSPTLVTPALGTPSSGTVTNLTGTASININGTVGATTANSGAFTTLSSTSDATIHGLTVGLGAGAINGNTALGDSALFSNTSGSQNTAVGANALYTNLTADNNTAVGNGALLLNTGGQNTAVGDQSLSTNSTGISNTAVGTSALSSNTTGSYNVGLGQGALVFNSTGSSSTGIGFGAGFNTTGSNNVYLGYRSGYSVTSGANNVIIGSYEGSTAPISATNSNWIVLSDGAGNVRQAIDSAGNSQFLAGAVVVYAPEPESISGSATLTNANLQKQIILGTGAANFTLPLGTTLETLVTWAGVNLGFNFSILSLSPGGSINVIGNTGTTYVGAQTISVGVSASFRIRRTAANTFVVYRIS